MSKAIPKYIPQFLWKLWLSVDPIVPSDVPRFHRYDVYDNVLVEIHQTRPEARHIFHDLDLEILDTQTQKELNAAQVAFSRLEVEVEKALTDLLNRTVWSEDPSSPIRSLAITQYSVDNIRRYLLFLRFRNSEGYAQTIQSLHELEQCQPNDGHLYTAYRPYMVLVRVRMVLRKFVEFLNYKPGDNVGAHRYDGPERFSEMSIQDLMHVYCWRLQSAELCIGRAAEDQEFILPDRCFGTLDEGFDEYPSSCDLFFPVFPSLAIYVLGNSDEGPDFPSLHPALPPSSHSIVHLDVGSESATDVHLRNAMILQTYPPFLYFRSLRTVALSISSYDEFRWIQEHQDYSRLKLRCRQKFLQETVTKTLVLKPSLIVTDLSDEVTVLGNWAVGYGAFSDVWKGSWQDPIEKKQRLVALKFLRQAKVTNREKLLKRLQDEVVAWHRLCHRNVVQLFGVVQSPLGIAMVAPWCENGTIYQYIKKKPDANRLRLLQQAASGIAYLHCVKPKIVHGDIKAGNILVDERGQAIINDFGLSKVIEDMTDDITVATSFFAGSTRWMALEIVAALANDEVPPITTHSDVYAFGSVCLELATDKLPYHQKLNDHSVTLDIIRGIKPQRGSVCLLTIGDRQEAFWNKVEQCWHTAPDLRPSMSQMVSFLYALEKDTR